MFTADNLSGLVLPFIISAIQILLNISFHFLFCYENLLPQVGRQFLSLRQIMPTDKQRSTCKPCPSRGTDSQPFKHSVSENRNFSSRKKLVSVVAKASLLTNILTSHKVVFISGLREYDIAANWSWQFLLAMTGDWQTYFKWSPAWYSLAGFVAPDSPKLSYHHLYRNHPDYSLPTKDSV